MNALFDHQAESALIGEMMQWTECLRHTSELSPDDFDDPRAAAAFEGLQSLRSQKQPVDLVSLGAETLRLTHRDVSAYLMQCARTGVTSVMSATHARMIAEFSRRRKIYTAMRGQADKLLDIRNDTDEVTQGVIADIKSATVKSTRVSMKDAMAETFDELERAAKMKADGKTPAVQTGITLLDSITGGLWPGQNIVIAGNTGTGKSAFAMEIAVNVAMQGKHVLICSAEMSRMQYTQRIWARKTGVTVDEIKNADIGEQQWGLMGDAANDISALNIEYLTETYAIEKLRADIESDPPDLVVIDYLQLLDTKKRTDNESVRIAAISTAVKRIALANNIPVVLLSQLSRQDGRAAVMPINKDLKGSGNIEQDADVIVFLHAPEAPSDKSVRDDDKELCKRCLLTAGTRDEMRYVIVNVSKQRQGRLGMFPLIFRPGIMTYTGIGRRK